MTRNKERIVALLAQVLEVEIDEINNLSDGMQLTEIGMESIKFIQFVASLEKEFDIQIKDSDLVYSNFQDLSSIYATLDKYFSGLKKVLVCDGDNSLWHGVAGEEEVFIDEEIISLQNEIVRLYRSGILLCLCSKNDIENTAMVFEKIDMPLRWEHFIIHKVNWSNKSDNVKEMADELNLSEDSFVFIDDSEYEIDLLNVLLPDITTVKISYKESKISEVVKKLRVLFDGYNDENNRNQLYVEQKEREKEKKEFDNFTEYNKALNTIVICDYAVENSANRIAELSQRTNQCNLSGKRYLDQEVKNLIINKEYAVFELSVSDRYGDMGIVGAAVVHKGEVNVIEAFFLSCRAFDRGFESVLLNRIKQSFGDNLLGIWIDTGKNKRFRDLYHEHEIVTSI